jgi:hypothetical protein
MILELNQHDELEDEDQPEGHQGPTDRDGCLLDGPHSQQHFKGTYNGTNENSKMPPEHFGRRFAL